MNGVSQFFRELTLRPQGLTIVVAGFLPIIAIVAMGPAVPALIEHFANDPNARRDVPAMIGAPGLAMALLAPFAGMLADRIGRRKLLLLSTLLYGVFGTAPFFLNNLDQIFWSRVLLGVSEAGILTVVNTLIGDYWDEKGRKNWLFMQGILGPFIAAFVSLIVGYATKAQWNGVFLVYLVAFPIWAAMMVWLFEPRRDAGGAGVNRPVPEVSAAPAAPFPIGNALLIAAVTFGASLLYYVFIINGALVFKEVGVVEPDRYGRLIFFPSLFILAGAAIFRVLADRSNGFQLGAFLTLLGTGLAGMGLAQSVSMMVVALIIQQTAAGMTVPTLLAWTQTKFGFAHRGRGMGIWTGAFFLGQSQSPKLVYFINTQIGSMQGAFLIAGGIGLAAGLLTLVQSARRKAQA